MFNRQKLQKALRANSRPARKHPLKMEFAHVDRASEGFETGLFEVIGLQIRNRFGDPLIVQRSLCEWNSFYVHACTIPPNQILTHPILAQFTSAQLFGSAGTDFFSPTHNSGYRNGTFRTTSGVCGSAFNPCQAFKYSGRLNFTPANSRLGWRTGHSSQ